MLIKTRIALAAVLVFGVTSVAVANDAASHLGKIQSEREWTEHQDADQGNDKASASRTYNSTRNSTRWTAHSAADACPTLEGYPDCH